MATKVVQSGVSKVVTFYKNGDTFFRGYRLAITPRRYRNMETLLNDLTRLLGLPHGARYVLTKEGKTVQDLNEFESGQGYICSSFPKLKNLKYGVADRLPYWNSSRESRPSNKEKSTRTAKFEKVHTSPERGVTRRPSQNLKPKIITVLRYGHKPRRTAKVLLNKRTTQTFDQVLDEVTKAIGIWGTNGVRRLYNLRGDRITDVSDLFLQDDCFIAVGNERLHFADLDEINQEIGSRPTVTANNKLPSINGVINKGDTSQSQPEQRSPPKAKRNSIKLPLIGRKLENENHKRSELKGPEDNRHKRPLNSVPVENHSSNTAAHANPHSISYTPNGKGEALREKDDVIMHDTSDKADVVERKKQHLFSHRKSVSSNQLEKNEKESKPKNVEDVYTFEEKIGDGNFAVVRVGIEKLTKAKYALKIIDRRKLAGKEVMLKDEIRIMKGCFHGNIARLYDTYETPLEVYLVMELVTGGDLFDEISNSVKFDEPMACGFVRDIANALQYLHKRNIVHRDLKPENLLVHVKDNGKKQLKLADFGLAVEVKVPLFTVCGTPTYVAPEILEETGYGVKVDIWAAGVILYIMLCGFPPFRSPNKDQDELFDLIVAGDYEFLAPYWDDVSQQAKDLVKNLLVVDRRQRYTAQQTLDYQWLQAQEDVSVVNGNDDAKSQKSPFNARRKFKGAAIAVKGSRRLKNIALDFQFKRGEKLIV